MAERRQLRYVFATEADLRRFLAIWEDDDSLTMTAFKYGAVEAAIEEPRLPTEPQGGETP